jgi:hypothetical protein
LFFVVTFAGISWRSAGESGRQECERKALLGKARRRKETEASKSGEKKKKKKKKKRKKREESFDGRGKKLDKWGCEGGETSVECGSISVFF